jgi:hypothetical protein
MSADFSARLQSVRAGFDESDDDGDDDAGFARVGGLARRQDSREAEPDTTTDPNKPTHSRAFTRRRCWFFSVLLVLSLAAWKLSLPSFDVMSASPPALSPASTMDLLHPRPMSPHSSSSPLTPPLSLAPSLMPPTPPPLPLPPPPSQPPTPCAPPRMPPLRPPAPPRPTVDILNERFRSPPTESAWPADGSAPAAGLLVHCFDGWGREAPAHPWRPHRMGPGSRTRNRTPPTIDQRAHRAPRTTQLRNHERTARRTPHERHGARKDAPLCVCHILALVPSPEKSRSRRSSRQAVMHAPGRRSRAPRT